MEAGTQQAKEAIESEAVASVIFTQWENWKMDYRIKMAAFFVFAFAVNAPALAALPSLVWCNGCSDAQKKTMASDSAIGTTVYVGDLVNRNVNGYFIDQAWTEDNPAQLVKKPTRFTPVAPQLDAVNGLIEFYQMTPVGWKKAADYNYPNSNINVYDVVNNGPDQRDLTIWVGGQPYSKSLEVRGEIFGITNMFSIGDASKLPSVDFVITFTDGSEITVTVDYSGRTPTYKVKPNSGWDSHHNPVLTSPSNTPVVFRFTGPGNPNDYNDWLFQMHLLNYDVPVGPGSYWACTNSAAGYHCVHPY